MDEDLKPRAAVGHMPFPGHRTQKQVRMASESRKWSEARRAAFEMGRKAQYGYEPEALKAVKR